MPTASGDCCSNECPTTFVLTAGRVIDVESYSVDRVRHFGVGWVGGRESGLVDSAIHPLGVTRIGFEASAQGTDLCWVGRWDGATTATVSEIRGESLALGEGQRVAGAISEVARFQAAVGVERTVTPHVAARIVDLPGATIEDVVQRVVFGLSIGSVAGHVVGFTGTEVSVHSLCLGPQLVPVGLVEIDQVLQVPLFNERQDPGLDAPLATTGVGGTVEPVGADAHREVLVGFLVIGQGQSNLLEIVLALTSAGGFASLLDRREQECNKDRDDRDHDKKFYECESRSP